MMKLLTAASMPRIQGLDIPERFYLVIQDPVPLAGMGRPTSSTPWLKMFQLGLRMVICLTEDRPDYLPEPLRIAGHFPLQDLIHGNFPADPKHELDLVKQAAGLAISLIERETGVVVHCAGGTGRTGTVIGCVLRGLGYNSSDILAYLDRLNRLRGARNGWPESKWQAEAIRTYINTPDHQSDR